MKLVWSRAASRDIRSIRDYIAQDNPVTAQRMVLHVISTVEAILPTYTDAGRPGRVPGTRELVIPRSPYIVPYRLREGAIEILRVFHAARRWPDQF